MQEILHRVYGGDNCVWQSWALAPSPLGHKIHFDVLAQQSIMPLMVKRLFLDRSWTHLAVWQRNLWVIVVVEILAILSFQAGFNFIPYYIQEMGITDIKQVGAWTGAYQSLGSVGFAISTPIWGVLGDRYGRKVMLVRAMVATSLVMGLTGLVGSPGQLLAVRAIQGFFTGTPSAASALVATGTPRERLAFALGMVQTAVFTGSSLGPMMGGYVADAYGYRAVFHVSAVIVFVCILLVVFLVREPEESAAVAAHARLESPWASFRTIVSVRSAALLISFSLLVSVTTGIVGPILPIFIQQLVMRPDRLASTAGTISGVAAFSAALAALAIGRLSDAIGHRRVLLVCGAGMGLMSIPQALARSALSLGVLRAAQGLFQGGIAPSSSALLVDRVSKERAGAALGLSSSAGSIGYAIGPLLGAALLAATSARVILLITAVATIVTTVGFSILDHAPGKERAARADNA